MNGRTEAVSERSEVLPGGVNMVSGNRRMITTAVSVTDKRNVWGCGAAGQCPEKDSAFCRMPSPFPMSGIHSRLSLQCHNCARRISERISV